MNTELYLYIGLSIILLLIIPLIILITLTIKRSKKYPEKNFKNNFINVALTPLRYLGIGPFREGKFTMEKSLKYAMKKTGLTDYGNSDFIHAYNAIMNSSVHKKLIYSNIGYLSSRIEMNMTFVRRLKFINYIKNNPDVLKVPIRQPLFVMGLPRTGTTFIHRLLSLDPNVRSPLLWELLAPVPGVPGSTNQEKMNEDLFSRKEYVRKLVDVRLSMGDRALSHIHEIGYDLPEECINALSDEIPVNLQYLYSDYLEHSTFIEAIYGDVITNAYLYYKKVLQLLSYQYNDRGDNNKRWVLKCPIHLLFIEALAKAFPDAKLVWTHRHPVSAVPSLCSLLKSLHQVYYEIDCRDDFALGKKVNELSKDLLIQATKDINNTGLDCAHVIYNHLISDPIKIIQDIYEQFNWVYTDEYDQILKTHLEEDLKKREKLRLERNLQGQNAQKLHTYEPEEFGLTAEELSTGNYDKYVKEYNVPMSKN